MNALPDWPSLLAHLGSAIHLHAPVDLAQLADSHRRLGFDLPDDLASLYQVTNGVYLVDGQWYTVWPLDRLIETALSPTDGAKPSPSLLAFGDDGTGDPFCIDLIDRTTIHHWSMIEGEGRLVAPKLDSFLRAWITGSLPV